MSDHHNTAANWARELGRRTGRVFRGGPGPATDDGDERRERPGRRPSRRKRIAIGAGTLALCALLVGGAYVFTLSDLDRYEVNTETVLQFEDSKGGPLMLRGEIPSAYVTLDEMPAHLAEAVVAIEDRRFFSHGGIDPRSVGRAVMANASAGEIVEGGSTISQQLIKISYLEPERTWRRKFHEALLTLSLERRYSKEDILERYMNAVYLGSGARGMGAASKVYFGKPVSELTLAESAALAATIQLPSAVNLYSDPEALKSRAVQTIRNMRADGKIDATEANAAVAELTVMQPTQAKGSYGGWFADVVAAQTETLADRFDQPGSVRTTLDPDMQAQAEAAVNKVLAGTPHQAALVALDPEGRVVAMVGGRDYADSQFNRATQAQRQPGSTFKTFVYMTALAEGMSPDDVIEDAPVEIDGYTPDNFDGRFHGRVTLTTAFANSFNAAAVNLGQAVGLDNVAATARALGLDAEVSATPSLALGASEVTLLDLTEAYAGIATGRMPFKSHFVEGITAGQTGEYFPFDWQDPAPSAMSEKLDPVREQIAGMLRATVTDGTGKAVAGVPGAVGKTGTSQNFRDAWFVGWGNGHVVGVWVGNDDNSPMEGVTGGSLPAQIWAAFLEGAGGDAQTGTVAQDPAPEVVAREGQPQDVAPAADADALRDVIAGITRTGEIDGQALERAVRGLLNQGGAATAQAGSCNVASCDRAYRSFRASDCTYQPYGGGPRKLCTR
ncbi:1A family penicillin-binding protein [Maritimibacter alkaliphilus HTCC2654]|uniref:Putative MrcB penicillin binding protein B n=1 Tax=Maritimibacter alkaliphilus HTCC2654 TaxID=314271 RepID=A3V9U9_9RHOB|nr:PBP1A family penicillin-binding protein [Maritimibacter alkaliphilus]EAQ14690.1 putative MrcB penicillin binding protein B [Maritimibacter alkaliphilus HTCC2654]TYP82139.1 1A family penicillin-binding protein [Maritimibacter alkaliphilus HTCC2654]